MEPQLSVPFVILCWYDGYVTFQVTLLNNVTRKLFTRREFIIIMYWFHRRNRWVAKIAESFSRQNLHCDIRWASCKPFKSQVLFVIKRQNVTMSSPQRESHQGRSYSSHPVDDVITPDKQTSHSAVSGFHFASVICSNDVALALWKKLRLKTLISSIEPRRRNASLKTKVGHFMSLF